MSIAVFVLYQIDFRSSVSCVPETYPLAPLYLSSLFYLFPSLLSAFPLSSCILGEHGDSTQKGER